MLAGHYYPNVADPNQPCLVWLHGLLGSHRDWDSCRRQLPNWQHLTVDLPGHGESASITAHTFNQVCQQLSELLLHFSIKRYVLIGYSLGGRMAMYYSSFAPRPGLVALIVEGGHPGLTSGSLRLQRVQHDQQWANRFRQQPLEQVLSDWYQQAVFANLSTTERQALIAERSNNTGQTIAAMLEATSLGRQPWLTELLLQQCRENNLRLCYLCGEYDDKFQQIATQNHLPLRLIEAAGHNAHRANPIGYVQQLISFLKEC